MQNFKASICLLCFFAISSLHAQQATPQKVLFVGNSYTYFWNLPQVVAAFATDQNIPLSTQQSTAGGSNLGHHWRGERQLHSIDLIKEGDFDALILQDHSLRSIEAPDSLIYFGNRFSELARKSGTEKIYVYMTWSRVWDPYMQKEITAGYQRLAKAIDAQIVPVGPAWQRARALRPGFPLYDDDGSHPSALGTYLSACVFYGVLTGESPVGLPNRLVSKDEKGEKLYLSIQSAENAQFCQKVAAEIIAQMKQ